MPLGFAQFWAQLKANPLEPKEIDGSLAQQVADEEWAKLMHRCPSLRQAKIEVILDESLKDKMVLAWASRTHVLQNQVWTPSVLTTSAVQRDMLIGVNPSIPNGWALGCNDGMRYDLRSVMRHEILHGLGVSSSVTATSVGYNYGQYCFPNIMDLAMEDAEGNRLVHGCTFSDSESVYVNGVELFYPKTHLPGSSLSHTEKPGVLNYQVPPATCLDLDGKDAQLLEGIGLNCSAPSSSATTPHLSLIFVLLYMLFVLR